MSWLSVKLEMKLLLETKSWVSLLADDEGIVQYTNFCWIISCPHVNERLQCQAVTELSLLSAWISTVWFSIFLMVPNKVKKGQKICQNNGWPPAPWQCHPSSVRIRIPSTAGPLSEQKWIYLFVSINLTSLITEVTVNSTCHHWHLYSWGMQKLNSTVPWSVGPKVLRAKMPAGQNWHLTALS